ncbi:MAG: hypothetical protein AMXMBFR33_73010 [Candidatus Xenobia bacterium]
MVVQLLVRLASWFWRHPRKGLGLGLGVALASLLLAFLKLGFQADWIELFSPTDPYRKQIEALHREFPYSNDLMVLVRGGTPAEREAYLQELTAKLQAEPELFREVFTALDLTPYRKHALYYLESAQVETVLQTLLAFQPLLSGLGQEGLGGMLRAIPAGLQQDSRQRVQIVLKLINGALEQLLSCLRERDVFRYHSPFGEVIPLPDDPRYQILLKSDDRLLYNTLDNGQIHFLVLLPPHGTGYGPAPATVDRLRELLEELRPGHRNLLASLTGAPLLATDERRQCLQDAWRGAVLSLGLVVLLLAFGFCELGRPTLVLLALATGIAWTLGYASLTVGHLNFLTIMALSMLTGLGADLGIHVLARYAEECQCGCGQLLALEKTVRQTGSVVWAGALVTSAGFWTLHGSEFQPVAELGTIVGGGILLCCLALGTVFWSFVALLESRCHGHRFRPPGASALIELERRVLERPLPVVALFGLLTVAAALYGGRVAFDENLLRLQDPAMQAVQSELELARSGNSVIVNAVSVADNLDQVRERAARFAALPSVARVDSLAPLVPPDLASRRPHVERLVEQIARLREVRFKAVEGSDALIELQRGIRDVDQQLGFLLPALKREEGVDRFWTSWVELGRLTEEMGPGAIEGALEVFQKACQEDLNSLFELLREQSVEPPTLAAIPPSLRLRAIGTSGKLQLRIIPRFDPWQRGNLERFVAELRTVDPEVTGDALLVLRFNRVIHRTYDKVGWYTFASVLILLVLYFRRPVAPLLALLPVSVSLIWMLALMRWWGMAFNPANFIAVPLLVGIGASFGLQVVARAWEEGEEAMLSFSTGPAVIFSALLAMAGFGSLLGSAHVGVQSLGAIVACTVGMSVVASLALLPAVVRLMRGQRA